MEVEINHLKMDEKLIELTNEYWEDMFQRKRDGRLVAWCASISPFQILNAMDIGVAFYDLYSCFCSAANLSGELCERAEAIGYSPDLCSVVRSFVGFISGTPPEEAHRYPFGGLPEPDLLLCMPYCPGIYKMFEKYSRYYNVPLLHVERPRIHDALTKDQVDHLVKDGVEELKELIAWLEKFTGRKFDYDLLSEKLALEWETSALVLEGLDMCRNIPAPMSGYDGFMHQLVWGIFRGTPETVNYYKELNAELAERVAQKIGPLVGIEEKYRLYWDNLPVYFKTEELTKKFGSYGAVLACAGFAYWLTFHSQVSLDDPLKAIIELHVLNEGANRGLTGRIDWLTKLSEGYSLDGFVMQRSRNCLMSNMGQDDIMKAVSEKTGLPAVVIEGDQCDPRYYSDSEVYGKLDAFMEIVEKRGPRRG